MNRVTILGAAACIIAMGLAVTQAAGSTSAGQAVAAGPSVKILVDRDGWYRVAQGTLTALGVDPSNPNAHLSTGGQDVPFKLEGSNLEFYGEALDTPYSNTRTYWLSIGSTPGPRIETVNAGTPPTNPTGTFEATVKLKTREEYFGAIVNGIANNFFGNRAITPTLPAVTRTLDLPNADTSQTATLRITLNGYSATLHAVNVAFNGTHRGTVAGNGFAAMSGTFPGIPLTPVPSPNASQYTVTLSTAGAPNPCFPTAGSPTPPGDCSLTDEYMVQYRHTFMADDNALDFAPPAQAFSVGGFGTSNVRLLDISNPRSPRELRPTVSDTGSPHTIGINPPLGTTRLYAFTDVKVLAPKQVLQDTPSSLRTVTNQADLIIISHADFKDRLGPLVSRRATEGLSADTVDVQDVYDEFGSSAGAKDPNSIREFLSYAKDFWALPKPRYVLLVGDASFDPRNYVNYGARDFIPTIFVNAQFSPEPSADDSLADFNGDGVPELALGRLPVETVAQTDAMIAKIVAYATTRPPSPKSALLVSDNYDRADYHFDSFSDELERDSLVPNGVAVTKIRRADSPPSSGPGSDAETRANIIAEANKGPAIVNWFGHGSIGEWAGGLLKRSDGLPPNQLTNSPLSFYLMMTCQNAYFIVPPALSLGESLLRAENGAVAVWGSSGDTTPGGQVVAAKEATDLLFSDPTTRIGDAMLAAKTKVRDNVNDIDVLHTWTLLGDPTMRLRLAGAPTAVTLKSFAVARGASGVTLRWRTASESEALGYNVYRFAFRGDRGAKVNRGLIRAKHAGTAHGASYSLRDLTARRGNAYTYRLQAVNQSGKRSWLSARAIGAARTAR